MKFATFSHDDGWAIGVVSDDENTLRPLKLDAGQASAEGLLALIDHRATPAEIIQTPAMLAELRRLSELTLAPPIPRPRRNIFCVAKNYYEHAHEFADSGFDSSATTGAVPDAPIIFSKVPETVIATGAPIRFDPVISKAVDYEAELAVIIGTGGRAIKPEQALAHVWGYTIVNDVTARDWQGRHKQWLLGKSFSTFCPMGPWAVTADLIDLANTEVKCYVNGELRQNANTRDLIFDVPTLIATISAAVPLLPGDIIATGTPAGVGIGFNPPKYLRHGDVVRVEIGGIGSLENPVVTGSMDQ